MAIGWDHQLLYLEESNPAKEALMRQDPRYREEQETFLGHPKLSYLMLGLIENMEIQFRAHLALKEGNHD